MPLEIKGNFDEKTKEKVGKCEITIYNMYYIIYSLSWFINYYSTL